MKTRHLYRILGQGGAWLFFILFAGLTLPEASAAGGEAAVNKEESAPLTLEKLNALKAEWEAVREQQIQMIREKEETLEKMKEDLFRQKQALVKAVSDKAGDGLSRPEPSQKAGGGTHPELQAQEMLLQKKAEELAAREKALKEREAALGREFGGEGQEEETSDIAETSPADFEKEKGNFEH